MSRSVLIGDEIFGSSSDPEPTPFISSSPSPSPSPASSSSSSSSPAHNFEPVRVARDAKAPPNKDMTFAKYYQSGPAGYNCLVKEALAGKLDKCPLRSIAWRVFLDVIPIESLPEEWIGLFANHRNEYTRLKEKNALDPHHNPLQSSSDHPLLDNPDSQWDKYYKAEELKTEIMQDIVRTYQEMEYFQLPETHEIMMNILFTYCSENPDVSYRQGMHELLAVILYLMKRDVVKSSDVDPEKIWTIVCDEQYFEHDAFTLFCGIMRHTKNWFLGAVNRSSEPPIVVKSRNIQHVLLKKIDPLLSSHLSDLGVEPQIYALRWVRLMFGREFHIEDVLLLWDAIFAYGNQFVLVEYICIAMLLYIRDELLEKDSNECLFRLLKFPPVEDVRIFVTRSKDMIEGKHPLFSSPAPERPPSILTAISAAVKSKSESHEIPISEKLKKLEAENQAMKVQQEHLASRLERIVHVLQQSAMKNTQSEDFEATILALAELKQVKDVMGGLLPYDSMMPQL